MPEVTYYVAQSVDGFIATEDGGIDWLACVEREAEDYGYARFFAGVDGLLMGRRTYEQVLGWGQWPYGDKPCWVFTSRPLEAASESVRFVSLDPEDVLRQAAEQGLERLWLTGGATLAASFLERGFVSRYVVSIVPIVLGAGVPLVTAMADPVELRFVESRSYPSGLVQAAYVPRRE